MGPSSWWRISPGAAVMMCHRGAFSQELVAADRPLCAAVLATPCGSKTALTWKGHLNFAAHPFPCLVRGRPLNCYCWTSPGVAAGCGRGFPEWNVAPGGALRGSLLPPSPSLFFLPSPHWLPHRSETGRCLFSIWMGRGFTGGQCLVATAGGLLLASGG